MIIELTFIFIGITINIVSVAFYKGLIYNKFLALI